MNEALTPDDALYHQVHTVLYANPNCYRISSANRPRVVRACVLAMRERADETCPEDLVAAVLNFLQDA